MAPPQSFVTSYAPRLRQHGNTLLQPVSQTQTVAPTSRTTKRGTTAINYADDLYDDDDFDDSDNTRRPTGLRSLRQQDVEKKDQPPSKLGKEIYHPVDVQPIFRPWLLDTSIAKARRPITVEGAHAQAQFPLTLIPIRIDLEIPMHQQDTPFPIPSRAMESGINLALPPFRRPEISPGYKIRDMFLWNLHEALYTPDDFAQAFVQDLDIPNAQQMVFQISHQIRTQLEDYAGVALHPLFHTSSKSGANAAVKSNGIGAVQPALTNGYLRDGTPRPLHGVATPRPKSVTPAVGTPAPSTPQPVTISNGAVVTAVATPMPVETATTPVEDMEVEQFLNPDDMYRCIVKLSIYLSSRLYEDKFEWSLLHPPGAAEAFAKQTCADMGLNGEWSLAITHAIYEAVLKLKKETCEGGMMIGSGLWGTGEVDNQAVRAEQGAGWRYDDADFGAEWEPKLEALSKEEIEKREGDRERQLRRLRRETAKFSSTSGMAPSAREQEAQVRASYFDTPGGGRGAAGDETPLLGRGERSRKKRRLRSPSPTTGKVGTPGEEKPTDSGWGGVGSKLEEYERSNWKCRHCQVHGSAVWAVRDGPVGPRTLCNNCGLLYERDKILPVWCKDLHAGRQRLIGSVR